VTSDVLGPQIGCCWRLELTSTPLRRECDTVGTGSCCSSWPFLFSCSRSGWSRTRGSSSMWLAALSGTESVSWLEFEIVLLLLHLLSGVVFFFYFFFCRFLSFFSFLFLLFLYRFLVSAIEYSVASSRLLLGRCCLAVVAGSWRGRVVLSDAER
jgi:hypothetical protein